MNLARRNAESNSALRHITGAVVDSAFHLHKALGPGLLESVYEAILARDLAPRGFHVARQRSISFEYQVSASATRLAFPFCAPRWQSRSSRPRRLFPGARWRLPDPQGG